MKEIDGSEKPHQSIFFTPEECKSGVLRENVCAACGGMSGRVKNRSDRFLFGTIMEII